MPHGARGRRAARRAAAGMPGRARARMPQVGERERDGHLRGDLAGALLRLAVHARVALHRHYLQHHAPARAPTTAWHACVHGAPQRVPAIAGATQQMHRRGRGRRRPAGGHAHARRAPGRRRRPRACLADVGARGAARAAGQSRVLNPLAGLKPQTGPAHPARKASPKVPSPILRTAARSTWRPNSASMLGSAAASVCAWTNPEPSRAGVTASAAHKARRRRGAPTHMLVRGHAGQRAALAAAPCLATP